MTNRSPFAAAAERLDRLLAEVKDSQFAATGVTVRPAPPPKTTGAPDAAWRQHYAARLVRPHGEGTPPLPEAIMRPVERPSPPSLPEATGHPATIGAVLGKPGKPRGLLGRLFGRGKR
jgi:hypothetical protein